MGRSTKAALHESQLSTVQIPPYYTHVNACFPRKVFAARKVKLALCAFCASLRLLVVVAASDALGPPLVV